MEQPPGKAWLIVEDGTVVEGQAFGAYGTVYGELVFTTGMTGYQESLTDPSFHGQVLAFTYPMIGNYGVNSDDWESDEVWPRAVVVREWCREPSHRKSKKTLDAWLREQDVPGIAGVDTRVLTLKVRAKGCLKCFVTHDESQVAALREKVASMAPVDAHNLAGEASVQVPRRYGRNPGGSLRDGSAEDPNARTVAVIDTGIKRNILRNLARRFNVHHHPWNATPTQILAGRPDALFIANGPGDPAHPSVLAGPVATVRDVAKKLPTFGICYGNQIVALAFGAKTYKMPFGHRGANIPTRDLDTGIVRITSQNHGFAVDAASTKGTGLRVWEQCPNDGAVEGLKHESLPVFTTQYHPEACPGPVDSGHLFDAFLKLVEDVKGGTWKPGKFPQLAGGHGDLAALPAS